MTQPRDQLAMTFESDPGVPRRPLGGDFRGEEPATPGAERRAGPQIDRPWIRRSPPASRKHVDGPSWLEAPESPRPPDAEPAWASEEGWAAGDGQAARDAAPAAPAEEAVAPAPVEAITQPLPEEAPPAGDAPPASAQHDTEPDPIPLGAAAAVETPRQRAGVAALWRRAVAGAVDAGIILATVGGAAALGAWAFGADRLAPAAARGLDFFADALLPHRGLVASLVLLAAAQLLAYEWLAVAFGGRTAGQALVGVRVVSEDGGPLDLASSGRRALALVASLATCGFGLALALVDARHQALHDKVAGSLVVLDDSGMDADA